MNYILWKANFIPDFILSIPDEDFYKQLIQVKNGLVDYQDLVIPDSQNIKQRIDGYCLIIAKQDGYFLLNNQKYSVKQGIQFFDKNICYFTTLDADIDSKDVYIISIYPILKYNYKYIDLICGFSIIVENFDTMHFMHGLGGNVFGFGEVKIASRYNIDSVEVGDETIRKTENIKVVISKKEFCFYELRSKFASDILNDIEITSHLDHFDDILYLTSPPLIRISWHVDKYEILQKLFMEKYSISLPMIEGDYKRETRTISRPQNEIDSEYIELKNKIKYFKAIGLIDFINLRKKIETF